MEKTFSKSEIISKWKLDLWDSKFWNGCSVSLDSLPVPEGMVPVGLDYTNLQCIRIHNFNLCSTVWFTCRICSALHIQLVSAYAARLNAVYGEATLYMAIEGLLRSSAQRPLAVHKGPIHHSVARSFKKVL